MTPAQQVIEAVSTHKATTSQGLLQRAFAFYFNAFVYNQIWEDPRVDLEALELDGESRILTISSGGCNALNYLVEEPESVTAVDLNRYHIYLLQLKLAALRHLPDHESFFKFFGNGKHSSNLTSYEKHIAPHLDDDARGFWQSNGILGHFIHGERINYFARGGLYQHSRNGYFLRFFHGFAHLVGLHPEKILAAKTVEEQEELFEKNISPFFDSSVIRFLGKFPVTMFGLGIPPQQLEELKSDMSSGGSLIDIYRQRAKKLACGFPIQDNYFAWQAFARKYDTRKLAAIPEYLKPQHFGVLKASSHRIHARVGSVTDAIKESSKGTFNRFIFLDAQDWMNSDTMTELWHQISEKGGSDSRIIFRTAAKASPLPKSLPVDLLARFHYEKEASERLFSQDRASIYGGFHLYRLVN